jgi:nucleotide-binding universal stress UspA family protein
MKILLAVDGSAYTKKMLAYLVSHPQFLHADNEYHAFTAVPALPPRVIAHLDKATTDDFYRETAEKVFGPIDLFLARHKVALKTRFKPGSPGQLIADQAERGKFDLVVMGSHGHGSLKGLVMGSVATSVLAHCKVPVLIVR